MSGLSISARILCILIALFSFGMLFIGRITPMGAAGILGFAAAVTPVMVPRPSRARLYFLIACAALAIVAQAGDVAYYYAKMNFRGNYYPWVASLFYFAAFGLMLAYGLLRLRAWKD
jgi:hypothetical protein